MVVSRFAPSPTGCLHLGHAFSAREAWRRAREAGGRFLLRFEDIDHTRVREEFYEGIEEDLRWLGLDWDGEPVRQLDRMEAYGEALARLKGLGVVYPCFCTRRDLAAVDAPQAGDGSVRYPGICRGLPEEERVRRMEEGEAFSWRLDAGRVRSVLESEGFRGSLFFEDEERGRVVVEPELLGDVVLARKDIATSYHIAVVVDDAWQGVTDVVRGEDLLESTHVHRVLQELLGLPEPRYRHHRLVLDEEGKRLAKRHDALSIRAMREAGMGVEEVFRKVDE